MLGLSAASLAAGAQTADAPAPDAPAAPASAASAASTQKVEIQGVRLRERTGRATLDHEALARLPGTAGDPLRAVQSLPGVASIDDSSSEPAVRGARPTDNLYYVDFLPVGYLFHVGGGVSVFNADLIRRFDLYSAAWSPEYGDAIGAVFDASLRRPREDRLGAKLDLSLVGASALVEGPVRDGMTFFLAARRSYFDLVLDSVGEEEDGVTVSTPVFSDSQGRLLWNLNDSNRLRLDFSTAADRLSYTLSANAEEAQRDPVLVGSGAERKSYRSVAAVWDADFGSAGANTLALGQMSTREFIRLGGAGTTSSDITTTYLRQQWQAATFGAHEFTFGTGVQQREVDVDIDIRNPRCTEFDPNCDLTSAERVQARERYRFTLGEAYASDRWRFASSWSATLGLRYSRDGYLRQSSTEPRFAIEWEPTPRTTLSAAVGRHSQAPTVDQTLRELGNPGLGRLRSNHVSFGVAQNRSGWSWRAEVYAKRFDDLVVSDAALNYRNGARGRAEGIELLIKREPVHRWSGFVALTLSRARRTIDGSGSSFPFDYDQPVIVTTALQYKQSDKWLYGMKWSYRSGTPVTPVVGTDAFPDGRVRPIYGAINSQRLPAYHRLDLRVDAQFSSRLSGYVELINAYGRKNVAGYDYSADYSKREFVYQLPAFLTFGLQYQF
jgi:hypothetical protein